MHLHRDEQWKGRVVAFIVIAITLAGQTQKAIAKVSSLKSEITAYSPTVEECDTNPFKTASGQRVRVGGVAADIDVLPFGSLILIPGYNDNRICEVIDTGGAISGTDIDVFFWTKGEAIKWGRQKHVLIKVLRFGKGGSAGSSNPVSRELSPQQKLAAKIGRLLKESLRPMRVPQIHPQRSFAYLVQSLLSGKWLSGESFTKITAMTSIFSSSVTLTVGNLSTSEGR